MYIYKQSGSDKFYLYYAGLAPRIERVFTAVNSHKVTL